MQTRNSPLAPFVSAILLLVTAAHTLSTAACGPGPTAPSQIDPGKDEVKVAGARIPTRTPSDYDARIRDLQNDIRDPGSTPGCDTKTPAIITPTDADVWTRCVREKVQTDYETDGVSLPKGVRLPATWLGMTGSLFGIIGDQNEDLDVVHRCVSNGKIWSTDGCRSEQGRTETRPSCYDAATRVKNEFEGRKSVLDVVFLDHTHYVDQRETPPETVTSISGGEISQTVPHFLLDHTAIQQELEDAGVCVP